MKSLYTALVLLVVSGLLSLAFLAGLPSLIFLVLDEHPSVAVGALGLGFFLLQVVAFLSWDPPPQGLLRGFAWNPKVLVNLPVAVLGHPLFSALAWLTSGVFATSTLADPSPELPQVSRHLTQPPSISLSLLVLIFVIFPLRLLVFFVLTCYRRLPLAVHLSHFLVAQRP
eukprot:RCo045585